MKKAIFLVAYLLFIISPTSYGQDKAYILDRVVAVVGDFHILQSEIEQQYLQMRVGRNYVPESVKCEILDYFINQKLLMTQAKIDSIEVTEGMVELEMQNRLDYYISQFGTVEEMEEYFNMSIYDIRDDIRKTMKDVMMTSRVQQSIIEDIAITPSEVKSFYRSLPADSIPLINSEVKIAQIVIYPQVDEDAEFEVKERLLELRKRILDGESMSTLAILYSDDPTATSNFGEIGFRSRNEGLDPAYVEAAWALKEGQVSKIIESSFGYHIIQCIARSGDRVNTRHILLIPKISAESKAMAQSRLDSIRTFITTDSMSFDEAAYYFSEDNKSSFSGGIMVNPENQAAFFELDQLDEKDYYTVRDMEVGDLSQPYESTDEEGKLCYKIVRLVERTEPHRANLTQDYLLLQDAALMLKQDEVLNEWYTEKRNNTYIRIDPSFDFCQSENQVLSDRK